jgi:hypothetical protein
MLTKWQVLEKKLRNDRQKQVEREAHLQPSNQMIALRHSV